jgi:glutamate/tyrosine decarboxylase-like PLP-dependent enzyme
VPSGDLRRRTAPLELSPEDFRAAGHELVDLVAGFLASLPAKPVAPGETVETVRAALGAGRPLPEHGEDPAAALREAAELLFEHSTFNGHPRFFGYVTSSAAPVGALADLLAAAVNPNVGGWTLSPMATEIEAQTVRWIAELLGYAADCGGLLVSGGNMANFVGLLAARCAKLPWDVRRDGVAAGGDARPRVYASAETHTWLTKAADLFGLGGEAVRWIPTDGRLRLDVAALRSRLAADREAGDLPFLVVGTAGSVSTGAIDPLDELAALCREEDLWLHVDGAYGGFAAALPDAPRSLAAIAEADSVAVDPHKWLYAPLEAGCALVRDRDALHAAFSGRPSYYAFPEVGESSPVNYFEWGPQNSRGFRALKVWLGLRQAGREGVVRSIADDIALARELHRLVEAHPELEPFTCDLSIATFRYVPPELRGDPGAEEYVNELNAALVERLQQGGEAFVSNAVVRGAYLLRACIVNFRTSLADVEALPALAAREGAALHAALRGR